MSSMVTIRVVQFVVLRELPLGRREIGNVWPPTVTMMMTRAAAQPAENDDSSRSSERAQYSSQPASYRCSTYCSFVPCQASKRRGNAHLPPKKNEGTNGHSSPVPALRNDDDGRSTMISTPTTAAAAALRSSAMRQRRCGSGSAVVVAACATTRLLSRRGVGTASASSATRLLLLQARRTAATTAAATTRPRRSTVLAASPGASASAVAATANAFRPSRESRRRFGSRGARGHGWYVKYREERGGRHLQGEYYAETEDGEDDLYACLGKSDWNDAVMQLGKTERVYFDVQVVDKGQQQQQQQQQERSGADDSTTNESSSSSVDDEPSSSSSPRLYRLEAVLAGAVMPDAADHLTSLVKGKRYVGTVLGRYERNVGWTGGGGIGGLSGSGGGSDVAADDGSGGEEKDTLSMSNRQVVDVPVETNPLALWHVGGTLSMLVPRVGQIDSRFLLVTSEEGAPHLDGIHRAVGQLTPESLAVLRKWSSQLLTRKGKPTAVDLIVRDCGVLLPE